MRICELIPGHDLVILEDGATGLAAIHGSITGLAVFGKLTETAAGRALARTWRPKLLEWLRTATAPEAVRARVQQLVDEWGANAHRG